MDQGIMVVDADRMVPVCNHSAIEIMELPPELVMSRPRFDDILAYQRQHHEFDGPDESLREVIRAGGGLDEHRVRERRRPNG
jgi:PAS fold